jgi:hypothetical protein
VSPLQRLIDSSLKALLSLQILSSVTLKIAFYPRNIFVFHTLVARCTGENISRIATTKTAPKKKRPFSPANWTKI